MNQNYNNTNYNNSFVNNQNQAYNANQFNQNKPISDGYNNYNYQTQQSNNNGNKRKSPIIIILILVILFAGIVGFGTIELDKLHADEDSKNVDNKDYNTDNDKKENNDKKDDNKNNEQEDLNLPAKNTLFTFLESKEFSIKLKPDNASGLIYYYLDSYPIENSMVINGNDTHYYVLRKEIFINNNKLGENFVVNRYFNKDDVLDAVKDDSIRYETFKDTKEAKEYALIFVDYISYDEKENSNLNIPVQTKAFIHNGTISLKNIVVKKDKDNVAGILAQEHTLLNKKFITIEKATWCNNLVIDGSYNYVIYPNNDVIDVKKDHFYYIAGNSNSQKEYKVEIESGKLKEEMINEFKLEQILIEGLC